MRLIARALWAPVLALALLLSGCGREAIHKQQAFVFGTLVEVTVYGVDKERAETATGQVLQAFDRMHQLWHPWEPGPMERINAALAEGREAALDPETRAALLDARQYAIASDHLFNPAIGNLVRLWGFHTDSFTPVRPDPAAVARLVRAQPRLTDLDIGERTVQSRNRRVRIDLGGYAKGLALDRATGILRGAGIRNALINIGGNVMALGRRGDRPWHIAIQHPRRAGALAELDLRDGEAVGTSGDYQRFFELAGQRYCHLIDPRSGEPVRHTQAITVLTRGARAGVRSDVLSKPLFVAGPGAWKAMAHRIGQAEVLRVDASGRVEVTPSLAARLSFAPGVVASIVADVVTVPE